MTAQKPECWTFSSRWFDRASDQEPDCKDEAYGTDGPVPLSQTNSFSTYESPIEPKALTAGNDGFRSAKFCTEAPYYPGWRRAV